MATVFIAVASFVGFIVAYHTYGRYLARKVFGLDPEAVVPSVELEDGVDFVPTRRAVVFGHHFTSIAGTGPIVGPAIAVFWGWLPALVWVILGSIFVGAVHDFGALVISLRNRGQTIGDVASRLISHRARVLFLIILFMALSIVLAVFGLVIATIFSLYPETVLSVWMAMPLAIALGFWMKRSTGGLLIPSLGALALLYLCVWIGVKYLPISIPTPENAETYVQQLMNPVVIWTGILFTYCFIASVLPVWVLLQPRDFINSHQLIVALGLLCLGLLVARPELAAPIINKNPPADAPPIFPFLFITIACGAVSGFHCLVASGTTSKQIKTEGDAQYVGYGAMLLEGALAVLVILACSAGLGMGIKGSGGEMLTGSAAWQHVYGQSWSGMGLGAKVGAFIEGGANMIASLGIGLPMAVGIVAVMVACFAATTLDTATRLQRYVIQELGAALNIKPLLNKYVATSVAVSVGLAVALIPGPVGPGSGGLILWPLFGAINQLLAGLAFMVIAFYLIRHDKPIAFLVVPGALMVALPAIAMWMNIYNWYSAQNWLLVGVGLVIEGLQFWMLLEGYLMWSRAKGVLPEPLPPLKPSVVGGAGNEGGRSC
ncbi:MAG: carbon starvation protein A [Candidatus Hydrogenedentota bacterium]|nr:MAG: carbon starvation protein A [Candidatus Hydrogenedentota bacterium]